jgi:hypothetical protein
MAMSFAESFIRAYAERAVKAICIEIDKDGVARISFHERSVSVNLRDMVLQEEAFSRLGSAVNELLGIAPATTREKKLEITQIQPLEGST